MPANTAGQSSNMRNVKNSAGQAKSNVRCVRPVLPINLHLPSTSFVVVNPHETAPVSPRETAPVSTHGTPPASSTPVPASTLSYRKRKELEEKTGVVPTKKYKPRVGASQCSKCQADRTSATGHRQYFGNWFCPNTATETYEEWRARLAEKNYRKKDGNNS